MISIIILLILVLGLFIIQAIDEQDVYGGSTCFDNSSNRLMSEMMNCKSYFHYASLFSDLSRNMTTSSSDLFEDNNSTGTQDEDNIESQDNDESNTEVNGFQQGDALDTNQTLSSSSSDLFEDNNENTQLQENVEDNDTEINQQDEFTTELEGNNDNNTIFG
ncbi:MAG: hypothetical protein M3297_07460 [Thermoproteota archaeon]|nr:hypothetical protein [Thermoproteota archaeon]